MHNERKEPRKDEETGRWWLWQVVESEVAGAGGGWPLMEITLGGASAALAELYKQRESLTAQSRDVDVQIASMEQVKAALYKDAVAG